MGLIEDQFSVDIWALRVNEGQVGLLARLSLDIQDMFRVGILIAGA